MYCFGCAYNLSGLAPGACPECGQSFNPSDPSSFSRSPPRLFPSPRFARWARRVVYLSASSPWVIGALCHIELLFARARLGHWPNRMGGEPFDIGPGLLEWLFRLPLVGFFCLLCLAPILLLAAPWASFPPCRQQRRRELELLMIGVAAFALGALLLKLDFAGAFVWVMD